MDRIDNKANYRSPTLVTGYDARRRIGEDDYVNSLEVGYFVAQVRRLAGPSGSIIDMGAGTGKLSLALARLGYAVTAFDQSDAMLERAATLCMTLGTDGLRGELTLMRAARALAALEGARSVADDHLRRVAPSALRHRLRRNPLDDAGSSVRVDRAISELFG